MCNSCRLLMGLSWPMKPEEHILIRAQRLLAESAELGRQCAEFYERQDQAESSLGAWSPDLISPDTQASLLQRMNEREPALMESLKRCQALVERAHALRQAIQVTEAKIAAVEALQIKWGRTGYAQEKRRDN
jgi:hypothetical protein